MAEDILYTPEELAQKLKLSKYTIYEMIKRGEITAHHIGRSIRVSQEQLELYLLKTKQAANIYEAEIVRQNDLTYAQVKEVLFCVSTDLTGHVKIAINPVEIILSAASFPCSARNIHRGVVSEIRPSPHGVEITLNIGVPLVATITERSRAEMDIKIGSTLYAIFKTMAVKVLSA